ncbi:type II toxin-antitoxin system death-on-curing family toxin [Desulfosporosinus sp. PR]|uniref:type II toxin-antitoxin system death-on-curing family toxin n=1 Tax=Candidatus Desulfosporosinus nitrosoreducens TaxID=3401928 RepID=UPI0027FAE40A|nr:type II toxin-antitoxin system death-on-curing family toxin [Desulfosporosinus sp. PR]MDQ7095452.1 type II toxin-antitoxin system death-on-curing family toxin [Desulfosporosinus sp. PR]
MDNIDLLSVNDILEIHNEAIKVFGGSFGYYSDTASKIQSILDQQYPHFGYDKYPSPFNKAAMLWYFLTKNHCFVDGNKRVGFYAAVILLKINGYLDQVDDDDAFDKAIQITASQLIGDDLDKYINDLSYWLEERFSD